MNVGAKHTRYHVQTAQEIRDQLEGAKVYTELGMDSTRSHSTQILLTAQLLPLSLCSLIPLLCFSHPLTIIIPCSSINFDTYCLTTGCSMEGWANYGNSH